MYTDIKHIFFDLDHTLWDFDTNSQLALSEIYDHFKLKNLGVADKDLFISTYKKINDSYWTKYRLHQIDKNELRLGRFRDTLANWSLVSDELAIEINDFYVATSPYKTNLLPNAIQVLEYLHSKYVMHIITNGFREAVVVKLQESKLGQYFDEVVISEEIGFQKPHPRIFQYLLQKKNIEATNCLMIGDHYEADIVGAVQQKIKAILFNPSGTQHPYPHQIQDLIELMAIL
jgi:putative hydrolase of the HAD superfamily